MYHATTKELNSLGYYEFKQNDSGGVFDISDEDRIGHYVFVFASSYTEANDNAKKYGIYFNGVDEGIDCECCGDRWTKCTENTKALSDEALAIRIQELMKENFNIEIFINDT